MTIRNANYARLTPLVGMMASLFFSVAVLTGAPGLAITSPPDGSPAIPGQNLIVTVTPSGTFTQVVLVGEGPIGYSSVLTTAPYQFSVPIPAGISPGRYALTALGVSPSGNASSLPITLSVERTDAPVEIEVRPTTLNLPAGERTPLLVIGTYADGTRLDITRSSTITFSSNSAGVAAVDSQGAVTAVGPGMTRVVVHNSANNSLSIPVVVPQGLSVTPSFPVVYALQKAQFSTVAPGMAAVPVKWTISPQVGSISNSGNYTAPRNIATQQLVTVTVALRDDPSKSCSTSAVLFPAVAVTISPGPTLTLKAAQTQRFIQSVLNALDNDAEWSLAPKNLGSIDNTGLYSAPASIKNQQTVLVTATSIADQSKTASVTITLQP